MPFTYSKDWNKVYAIPIDIIYIPFIL